MNTVADVLALARENCQGNDLPMAEALYRQALMAEPGNAEAWIALATVCQGQGKLADAELGLRQALQVAPGNLAAGNQLGIILAQQGRLGEATVQFQQALELQPENTDTFNNLGIVLGMAGRYHDAIAWFRAALNIDSDLPVVHNSLAAALFQQGQAEEAVGHYRQALRLKPDYPDARANLGAALENLGQLEEAETHCREAVRLQPKDPEARTKLGNVLQGQGKLEESLANYEEALRLSPRHADAQSNRAITHWNRSLLWLLRGDFERGWAEYEWRWQRPDVVRRVFPQPHWDGASLEGRTILLYAEQGLGDTLQFIRFAPLVKQRGARVVVACQPHLLSLLASVEGIDQLLPQTAEMPTFHVQAALMSLPGLFHTTLDTIPATVPYLQADASLAAKWGVELSGVRSPVSGIEENDTAHQTPDARRFLIGIAWQGSREHRTDRLRSVTLAQFAPLAKLHDVALCSLQVGPGTEQLASHLADAANFPVTDLGNRFDPASLTDAAAAIMNMDLVITVDTVVAHLAGALGAPVWVALPVDPDWRWLLQREDSPWYPTLRLFRQVQFGKWDEVFERMAAAVAMLRSTRHQF